MDVPVNVRAGVAALGERWRAHGREVLAELVEPLCRLSDVVPADSPPDEGARNDMYVLH